MLTYTLDKSGSDSLYQQLYDAIKRDILAGALSTGEKLPSKRTLAAHLEISVITVKTAYEQLIAEGYICGVEKKGYYVMPVDRPLPAALPADPPPVNEEPEPEWFLDFAANAPAAEHFPFTTWAKLMRRTILERDMGLLHPTSSTGAPELRQAIAGCLYQFRGLTVRAEQIIVGAGTELLYHLLIQLLGRDKCYAVEDPGYSKIPRIYQSNGVALRRIPLDENGLSAAALQHSDADVVHISPTHHYPTGTVMPIGRRLELLRWAGEREGRYILEDDYDSEFRFTGKPIPTLYSVDEHERVVYLNTFSKTIAPSIRISYMVLPPHLLEEYRRRLGFYSCTVSSFEQYTLAQFLSQGRYEQHLNRMRKHYRQKRDAVIDCFAGGALAGRAEVIERHAGLHFLVRLHTRRSDAALRRAAAERGLRLAFLSDYYGDPAAAPPHILVVNYSGLALEKLPQALYRLAGLLEEEACTTN